MIKEPGLGVNLLITYPAYPETLKKMGAGPIGKPENDDDKPLA